MIDKIQIGERSKIMEVFCLSIFAMCVVFLVLLVCGYSMGDWISYVFIGVIMIGIVLFFCSPRKIYKNQRGDIIYGKNKLIDVESIEGVKFFTYTGLLINYGFGNVEVKTKDGEYQFMFMKDCEMVAKRIELAHRVHYEEKYKDSTGANC